MEERIAMLEGIVPQINLRLDSLDRRMDALEGRLTGRMDSLEARIEGLRSELSAKIDRSFWVLVGLMLSLNGSTLGVLLTHNH